MGCGRAPFDQYGENTIVISETASKYGFPESTVDWGCSKRNSTQNSARPSALYFQTVLYLQGKPIDFFHNSKSITEVRAPSWVSFEGITVLYSTEKRLNIAKKRTVDIF